MSGGSYDYLYGRVRDAAGEIELRTRGMSESEHISMRHPETKEWLVGPLQTKELLEPTYRARVWFAKLLELTAEAMHDIEWVDSSDYGPGDELQSIRRVAEFLKKAPLDMKEGAPAMVMSVRYLGDIEDIPVPPGYEPFSVYAEEDNLGRGNFHTVFFRKV